MVRLRGEDQLLDIKGRLSSQFRSATLVSLHSGFLAAASENDKQKAAQVLEEFYKSAARLCSSESEFNKRARHPGAPSLMKNLREPGHFVIIRQFDAAKEALLGMNRNIGESIVRMTERDLTAIARLSAQAAILRPIA